MENGRYAMQTPEEYRGYAEECERLARSGPAEHRETLLKIARGHECAANAEKRNNDLDTAPRGFFSFRSSFVQ